MKLTVLDQQGKPAGEVELGFELVQGGKGTQAVHDAVVAHLANRRSGTACAKTKAEVAGSGRKPWRQKGTGRARAGSTRSPLWPGGGVVFGPRPRDFSKKVGKRTRALALRKALSERIRKGDVLVVESIPVTAPRTREFVGWLRSLELHGTVLVVQAGSDTNLLLAARNVPGVEITTADVLNTYQVLHPDKVLITRPAFDLVQQRLQ